MESNTKYHQYNADFKSLMSCVDSNQTNFNYLIRLIRRGVVVPFIGAGFSANFGYPSWSKFLKEQATTHHISDILDMMRIHNYEKAATLLEEHLCGNMEYTLIQAFGDHNYKEHENEEELECLPTIFRSLILTTNFDEVVEMLYAKVNNEYIEKLTPKSAQDIKLCHKRIAYGEPTLIKLHGDVATREFVLNEQAYNEVYGKRILGLV